MERRHNKGIYALVRATAVVAAGTLIGLLAWEKSSAIGEKDLGGPASHAESATALPPEATLPPPVKPVPAASPKDKKVYPSFDHVRVAPNGENIFVGRVAPGATVEMIRNDQVYGRAVADTSGLFALSAPPLPVGSSQIYLQSIAPDGAREKSRDSVTVLISSDKTRRPLVALTSPDKPTVVLSNPDNPDAVKPEDANAVPAGKIPVEAAARPEIRIVSVEARDGGRLYVSCRAAPGASVKLYLNGAMVAPGGADSEGNLSFTIDRGMAAGNYSVRLDDVDPVTGEVRSKADATFTVPDLSAYQEGADEAPAGGKKAKTAPLPFGEMGKVTVARGDSLWRISKRYYGTGRFYRKIYDANRHRIKRPNALRPGLVLELPPRELLEDK